jgi:hypothetical protein
MPDVEKVPLSVKALLGRINRKLAPEQQSVKKARSLAVEHDCGSYCAL